MAEGTEKSVSERREDRQKQTAEVFTPRKLVNQILAKLPKEVWKKGKTFCDPACGNGNLLILVLERKINRGHKPLEALRCIYGVDIMRDNIRECRMRLLKVVSLWETITEEHIRTVFKNIKFLNSVKFPKGALDYDFSFKSNYKEDNVKEWIDQIRDGSLKEINLTVIEEPGGRKYIQYFDLFEKETGT